MPTSTLSFVAHPDDDVLFMFPDIASDIRAGYRVTVVYLTAGNLLPGPDGMPYADQRIQGIRDAYAHAAQAVAPVWVFEQLQLAGRPVVTNKLTGIPGRDVRLVFLYLNAAANADQVGDLARMWADPAFVATPIDGRPSYTRDSLRQVLAAIIAYAAPAYIRTQDTDGASRGDNVDHIAAAQHVAAANVDAAGLAIVPWYEYIGYATEHLPGNVSPNWQAVKTECWNAYRSHDPKVGPTGWDDVMDSQYKGRAQLTGSLWSAPPGAT